MKDIEQLAEELNPLVGYWDLLNLALVDFWDQGKEATMGFLRLDGVRSGSTAMPASVGYIVQANGIQLRWKGAYDRKTEDE